MLRPLEMKDADRMLEWMHDTNIVKNLHTDFSKKTLDDCHSFIQSAKNNAISTHFAVVNENNEYLGTVSLRIVGDGVAEFAIVMHSDARGKGISHYAMRDMIKHGFTELGLNLILWCVDPNNSRAIHFYDSQGYQRFILSQELKKLIRKRYSEEEVINYDWYAIRREDSLF